MRARCKTQKGRPHADENGKVKTKNHVTRHAGRYSFLEAILRPNADENGSAIYTGPSAATKNTFSKKLLRQGLDWRNSELVRRAVIGLSTISARSRREAQANLPPQKA